MKKTYIAPEMTVVVVETCKMVCASLATAGTTSENSITEGDSREFDFDFSDDSFNFEDDEFDF